MIAKSRSKAEKLERTLEAWKILAQTVAAETKYFEIFW